MSDPVTNHAKNSSLERFHHYDPTGPSLDQVKAQQTPGQTLINLAAPAVATLAHHGAIEVADHLAEHGLELAELHVATKAMHLGGTFNLYWAAISEVTEAAFKAAVAIPAERGDDLARAMDSDHARFAAVMIIDHADSSILPDGFVTEQKVRTVGTGNLETSLAMRIAQNIQADITKADPHAIAFRNTVVASTRAGLDVCHTRHITSEDACQALRAANPEFRARYDTDPGFQIGVRAGIWQAQVHPDEFDAAQRARGALLATVQLARSV